MINFINNSNYGCTLQTGIHLNHLVSEINKVILIRRDQLPSKACKVGEPHLIWIKLPLNDAFVDNTARKKFNSLLEKNYSFAHDDESPGSEKDLG